MVVDFRTKGDSLRQGAAEGLDRQSGATPSDGSAFKVESERDAMMENSRRTAEIRIRDLLLMALALSSGAVDSISYLGLGKVFTAFMSGNIVFLGLRMARAGDFDVVRITASRWPPSRREFSWQG
jgi:hypothetical protein